MPLENILADPDPELPVTRRVSFWIAVGNAIGRHVPFDEAAPLLVAIGEQLAPHFNAVTAELRAQAVAEAAAPEVSARIN